MAVQTLIDTLVKEKYAFNLMPARNEGVGEVEGVLRSVTGIRCAMNGEGILHGGIITKPVLAGFHWARGANPSQLFDILQNDNQRRYQKENDHTGEHDTCG